VRCNGSGEVMLLRDSVVSMAATTMVIAGGTRAFLILTVLQQFLLTMTAQWLPTTGLTLDPW